MRPDAPSRGRRQLGGLFGVSEVRCATFTLLERAAASDTTVLLEGESRTGKEEAARALHHLLEVLGADPATAASLLEPRRLRELMRARRPGNVRELVAAAARAAGVDRAYFYRLLVRRGLRPGPRAGDD